MIKTNVWNLTLILVKKKESNIKIRGQIFICDLVLFTFKNGCLTKPKYYKIHTMIRFTVAIYLPINLLVLMATPLKQFINPFAFSLLTSTRENLTPMFRPILWCLEHCHKSLLQYSFLRYFKETCKKKKQKYWTYDMNAENLNESLNIKILICYLEYWMRCWYRLVFLLSHMYFYAY